MATISASIGGIPVAGFQNFEFEIELGLGKRAKRATAKIIYGGGSSGMKPRSGQVLGISIDGGIAFEGPIHVVNDRWINPEAYEVTVDATDWTPFLDARLVHTEDLEGLALPEQLLSERIEWILSNFCPGFTLGGVENDEKMPPQAIDHQPASVVFDELAELTNQVFDLSFGRQVIFSQTGSPAPISSIDVDATTEISDVECTEDWSDLHNVLFIKDFKLRSAYHFEEQFTADGKQSFFKLSLPPWSVDETIVSVSKDGGASYSDRVILADALGQQSEWEIYRGAGEESEASEVTRKIELEKERQKIIEGNPGEAYVCLWNEGIRFPRADLPAEGDVVRVRYPFERPQQMLEVRDLTSIGVIAAREETDGIHQKVINLPELRANSLESAVNYARMLLARGAWPVLTGSFRTYVTGWMPGQKFSIYSGVRQIVDPKTGSGPANVWVSRVIMTARGIDSAGNTLVDHTVEFTSLPYAVPLPMDEVIWRLIDRTTWLRPPGAIPGGTEYTTSTTTISTSTTSTSTLSSTSTTITTTSTSTSLWGGAETPVRAQVMFSVPGPLTVGNDQAPWFICSIPHGLTLLGTNLAVKTAPTGSAIQIDIKRSADCGNTWSSIYETLPTIPAGERGCDESGELDTTYIVQDDCLRLDIIQVGSAVAGSDLTVSLRVRQGIAFSTSTSTTTGTTTSTSISGTSTSTTTTLMMWRSPSSVYSSCGSMSGYGPEKFIDGSTTSTWLHDASHNHEIILDLGKTRYVTKVRLYVYSLSCSQWTNSIFYISDDPTDWGTVPVLFGNFENGTYGAEWIERTLAMPKSGRYMKITYIHTMQDNNHLCAAEFEVYAS